MNVALTEVDSRKYQTTVIALFVGSAVYRIPFRSTQIFNGDSYGLAHGALFTWTAHPPGFIGYCTIVRLINYFFDDFNTSAVLFSIVSTAVATVLVFVLGSSM